MEPVEIDIKMRQNVSDEAPKVVDDISKISSESTKAQQELTDTIAFQKKIISELEQELGPLEEKFRKLNKATSDPSILAAREQASAAFRETRSELEGEKKALADLEKQSSSYSSKQQSLETQIRNVREEMARLMMSGQKESEQYRALEERLGLLGTAYKEVYNQQKALSSGSAQTAGILSGLSALSGAMAAGAGAMGLVNSESEAYAKIQTKVQSLMAITIGLEQIANALHQTSAFRITTVVKAKQLWAAANIKVAATLGISTVAAQGLMAVFTGGLSIAFVGIIALAEHFISKNREAAAEQRKFKESISETASKSITDFMSMQESYNALGDNLKDKKKFISDNQKAFDSLGVSITSVAEADNLFINNAEAFKASLLQRAQAVAAMELATEKIKGYYNKLAEADNRQMNPNFWDVSLSLPGPGNVLDKSFARAGTQAGKIRKEAEEDYTAAKKLIGISSQASSDAAKIMSDANIAASGTIVNGTKAYWENQKKLAEQTLSRLKDVSKGSKEWNDAVALYNKATAKLKQWDVSSKPDNKAAAAAERLKKIAVDTENDINAATAAAVEEGAARKLAKLKADYDKRISVIEQREKEIAEIEKKTGKPATKEREQLDTLKTAETNKYTSAVAVVSSEATKLVQEMWADVNSKFQSELDNNLQMVDKYYDEQLEIVRKNITDTGKLKVAEDELDSKRQKEKLIVRAQADLKALDMEESIALKQQEIKNRDEIFESTKQQNILKVQKEFAQKRLALLLAAQAAGTPDLEKDIQAASAEVEGLGYQIKHLELGRLREMSSYIRQFASVLSQIGGEVGKVFSAIGDSVDNLMTTLSKTATKEEKISAGISSLSQIVGMVINQIEANKQVQDAWTESIIESKQQMALLKIEALAYEQSNLFGVENPYSRAIAAAKQYSETLIHIKETAGMLEKGQIQTGTKKAVSAGNVATGLGSGAAAGAAIGSIVPVIGTAIGAVVGAVIGGIVGLFSKKTVPVFESLKKKYGEIYDKETFELNPKILADYSKLDKETKKIVDNWKEIKEKAKEAQAEMRKNFSDLAGDIGTQLSDALVNAFSNGDIYKGIDDFQAYMNGKIEDIISQLIFARHFQSLFDDLEKRFNKSFEDGGDQDIVDDMIWFSKVYKNGVEAFGKDMQAAKDELAKQGIDIYSSSTSRQGTSKSLAQASQESITELSGGVYSMRLSVADIRNINREQLTVLRAMFSSLSRISENTEYCRYIEDVKRLLEDLSQRGIKVKV